MKSKSLYRVFDWDDNREEDCFDTLKEARWEYKLKVLENPQSNWRLYKDTEKPHGSGNFTEDCLMSNRKD